MSSEPSHVGPNTLRQAEARRLLTLAGAWLVGTAATGFAAAFFVEPQAGGSVADLVRLATVVACITIAVFSAFRFVNASDPAITTAIFCGVFFGGQATAEAVSGPLGTLSGFWINVLTGSIAVWWVSKVFRVAPQFRGMALWSGTVLALTACVWFLARHAWVFTATAVTGIGGLALAGTLGITLIRHLLAAPLGIAAVARTAVDEALRQRTVVVLLVLLVVLIPILPLVLDQDERLEYRMQFFLSWALGGTSLILSLLTVFLGCGTICGDIDSSRIHMTLVKPLHRWNYLVGKWLGIMCFNALLLSLSGVGIYTFSQLLASTTATDQEDRDAVDLQILSARVAIAPSPKNPEEYEAAIDAAIDQLQKDAPDIFEQDPAGARRRIRSEYEWVWHTVNADMVSTFVFHGLGDAKRSGEPLQLQVKPRVNNVDVDLADVRFAVWLNGRPWPMVDGEHATQTLASLATHVIELPAEPIDESGSLEVTLANRNLIPDGEITPTAITLSPGDGLKLYYVKGGFFPNFVRCHVITLCKLAMIAAAAVAAASFLGFPSAVLFTLVVFFSSLGGGFLRDALAEYNMASPTVLGAITERLLATVEFLAQWRFYEAFRMFFGFATDLVLAALPAFSDYDGSGNLTAGLAIPTSMVLTCLATLGVAYPVVFGVCGWFALARRDLIPSTT